MDWVELEYFLKSFPEEWESPPQVDSETFKRWATVSWRGTSTVGSNDVAYRSRIITSRPGEWHAALKSGPHPIFRRQVENEGRVLISAVKYSMNFIEPASAGESLRGRWKRQGATSLSIWPSNGIEAASRTDGEPECMCFWKDGRPDELACARKGRIGQTQCYQRAQAWGALNET